MEFEKKTDEFYENQVKRLWNTDKFKNEFMEEYYIRDKNTGELKGTLKRYLIDEEYEISIFKLKDRINEKLFNPEVSANFMEIMYCLEGECKFTSNFYNKKNTYYFKKGDIIVHKTNNCIKEYDFKAKNLTLISIDVYLDEMISSNIKNSELGRKWKEKIESIFTDDEFYFGRPDEEIKILAQIIESYEIKNIENYLNFKLKVFQFIISIFELRFKVAPDDETIVNDIKNILKNNNYPSFPTINQLCEKMKTSRYKLHSSFIKVEGVGINQYLKKRKMEHSKLLLLTDRTILEIANEIGYDNPSKFSEAFKNYFKMLPSEYRKKIKNENYEIMISESYDK